MIDSGAEINVIGSELIKKLKVKKIQSHILAMQGVTGSKETVDKWVEISVVMENGSHIKIEAAVLPSLGENLILGMPFILSINAVPHFHKGILESKFGSVELYIGKRMKPREALAHAISADLPEIEKQKLKKILKEVNLNRSQRRKLKVILKRHRSLWMNNRRGCTNVLQHRIQVSTEYPIVQRPRRHSIEDQQIIDKEIDKMLSDGVIRLSDSPHASEVVLVKKKTGDWRFCIDFRLLNKYTILDKHPLPRIQDLLRSVRHSRYFCALDLRAGYWQIAMSPSSIPFTAFRTHRGLFEFLVMPFGLSNAPASFQRLMEKILGDLWWKGVLVYLDDILIHGQTVEEVLEKLEIVLSRLSKAGLTLNLDKCDFFPKSLLYLGHVLQDGQIFPNPKRISALDHIQKPTNVKAVRSLLGHFGYFRNFIPNFSSIASPLFKLLKKGEKFKWSEIEQQATEKLKASLQKAVLHNPLTGDQLLLETDASDHAVGAILSCRKDEKHSWKPVEFASKALGDTAKRWPTHEKEAFAIVWALQRFDCYLRGRPFVIHTDNSSLQWMHKASVGKIARWASRMSEYQAEIKHKSGKTMDHVDFLSRYVDETEEFLADRMVYSCQINDDLPSIEEIIKEQKKMPTPQGRAFAFRNGITFHRGRIWVPLDYRLRVVSACHHLIPYQHPGLRKTVSNIRRVFSWPGLHEDVNQFIKACLPCQRVRPGIEKLQGLLSHHEMKEPFEKVYMDIWECQLPESKVILLTMIDFTTKWVECAILTDKTAESIASKFLESWISRFGVPQTIVTDQAEAFIGRVMSGLCMRLGISKIRTIPHHPDGNVVESFHRVLTKGFSHFNLSSPSSISINEALSLILMGYRSTIHLGINETPAFMVYGTDLRPPIENDWRLVRTQKEQDRLRYLSLIRLEIMNRVNIKNKLMEEKFQERRHPKKFKIGDLILLPMKRLETPHMIRHEDSRKVRPKWSLPYRVIRINEDGKSATVRNCVSFVPRQVKLLDVSIQHARFINRPLTTDQQKIWNQLIEKEVIRTVLNPSVHQQLISEFWENIEDSPEDEQILMKKRRRT